MKELALGSASAFASESDDDHDITVVDDVHELALNGISSARPRVRVRHGTVRGSTATLVNCAVGAGVLATPYAARACGYVGAFVLIASTAIASAVTLRILVRAGATFASESFQGLVRDAFGARASRAVAATLVAYLFGSCVAYLIIIGDSYERVVDGFKNNDDDSTARAFWETRRCAIVVAATCVATPLSLARELTRLAPSSVIALLALAYTAIAIVIKAVMNSDVDGRSTAVAWTLSEESILAVPIVVFAFQCHIQVLSIFAELSASEGEGDRSTFDVNDEDDELELNDRARSRDVERRRVRRMYDVIAYAVGACFVGYALVGEFAYLAHPDVSSNVLDSYDKRDKVMMVATIFMGLNAVVSFPVNHHAARAAIDDLLADAFGWARFPPGRAPLARHASQTLAFVFLTAFVAFMVNDLGKVFELVGATCGSLVMFVVPAALLLHPKMRDAGLSKPSRVDDDLRDLDDVTRNLLSSAMGLLADDDVSDDVSVSEAVTDAADDAEASPKISGAEVGAAALLIVAAFVAMSNVYVLFFRRDA